MTPNTTSSLIFLALVPLIAWRLYSRIRRLIGRQQSKLWRHWAAATLFPLLLAVLGAGAIFSPLAIGALAAGIATGVGLSIWGLRWTRFEVTPQGWFYTPNAHIGIALSVILAARILYRLFQLYAIGMVTEPGGQDFARSPLTLLCFGMLASYYAAYAVGMLRWRRSNPLASAPAP
jgi:hypothetical protein